MYDEKGISNSSEFYEKLNAPEVQAIATLDFVILDNCTSVFASPFSKGLAHNGVIVWKENLTSSGEVEHDEEDRYRTIYKNLFFH